MPIIGGATAAGNRVLKILTWFPVQLFMAHNTLEYLDPYLVLSKLAKMRPKNEMAAKTA